MADATIIFDGGPLDGGTAFRDVEAIIRADTPSDIDGAFAAMQQSQSEGKWLAGYVSYEFGYLTSSKLAPLMPTERDVPLLQIGVFDAPQLPSQVADQTCVNIGPLQPAWRFDTYSEAFARVQDYIAAGDIYQANLTFPLRADFNGNAFALYEALKQHQPVAHGAFVDFGDVTLLSRSPELFFSLAASGQLKTRPMKGTAPRGASEKEDDAIAKELQQSEKNRAENLMIVDLLRNDLSRISEIGSVKVPQLFEVERFTTLHQMTSTITAQIQSDISLKSIFTALFPCGSITGAPKVRAMQIIRELEPEPRGAYCGAIGWIAPDGAMEFNVAIRTLRVGRNGGVHLNVGGGIVHDSNALDEYEEALLKARFVTLP